MSEAIPKKPAGELWGRDLFQALISIRSKGRGDGFVSSLYEVMDLFGKAYEAAQDEVTLRSKLIQAVELKLGGHHPRQVASFYSEHSVELEKGRLKENVGLSNSSCLPTYGNPTLDLAALSESPPSLKKSWIGNTNRAVRAVTFQPLIGSARAAVKPAPVEVDGLWLDYWGKREQRAGISLPTFNLFTQVRKGQELSIPQRIASIVLEGSVPGIDHSSWTPGPADLSVGDCSISAKVIVLFRDYWKKDAFGKFHCKELPPALLFLLLKMALIERTRSEFGLTPISKVRLWRPFRDHLKKGAVVAQACISDRFHTKPALATGKRWREQDIYDYPVGTFTTGEQLCFAPNETFGLVLDPDTVVIVGFEEIETRRANGSSNFGNSRLFYHLAGDAMGVVHVTTWERFKDVLVSFDGIQYRFATDLAALWAICVK